MQERPQILRGLNWSLRESAPPREITPKKEKNSPVLVRKNTPAMLRLLVWLVVAKVLTGKIPHREESGGVEKCFELPMATRIRCLFEARDRQNIGAYSWVLLHSYRSDRNCIRCGECAGNYFLSFDARAESRNHRQPDCDCLERSSQVNNCRRGSPLRWRQTPAPKRSGKVFARIQLAKPTA